MNERNVVKRETSKNWLAAGGFLLALSVFLPWVHVFIVGNITFMQLAQMGNNDAIGWLLAGAGCITALVSLGTNVNVALKVILALCSAAIGLYEGINLLGVLKKYDAVVQIEFGTYLAIFAGVLLLVGVFLVWSSDPTPSTVETVN
jgi:hypothetical protein